MAHVEMDCPSPPSQMAKLSLVLDKVETLALGNHKGKFGYELLGPKDSRRSF